MAIDDGSPEREVLDFYFKQLCKLKLFENSMHVIKDAVSLLAVSNKFGIILAVCGSDIKAVSVSTIEQISQDENVDVNTEVTQFNATLIPVGSLISHIAVTCESSNIVIIYQGSNGSLCMGVIDFKILSSVDKQGAVYCFLEICRSADVFVREVRCHPEQDNLIALCLSNGHVLLLEIKEKEIKIVSSLIYSSPVTTICWSPKGKQLAIGCRNGKLLQYDKMLKSAKKEIPYPQDLPDSKYSVHGLHWISSFLFMAVYTTGNPGDAPVVLMIHADKNDAPVKCTSLEDIYYGFNEERYLCYYFDIIHEWNLVISMASNAFEAAPVGMLGNMWQRWQVVETGRAEMPLDKDEETYPVGMAICLNGTLSVYEEDKQLPATPVFAMLSTSGVLCSYQMVNKFPNTDHTIVRRAERLPAGSPKTSSKHVLHVASQGPSASGAASLPVATSSSPVTSVALAASKPSVPSSDIPGSKEQLSGLLPASKPSSGFAFWSSPLPESSTSKVNFSFAGMSSAVREPVASTSHLSKDSALAPPVFSSSSSSNVFGSGAKAAPSDGTPPVFFSVPDAVTKLGTTGQAAVAANLFNFGPPKPGSANKNLFTAPSSTFAAVSTGTAQVAASESTTTTSAAHLFSFGPKPSSSQSAFTFSSNVKPSLAPVEEEKPASATAAAKLAPVQGFAFTPLARSTSDVVANQSVKVSAFQPIVQPVPGKLPSSPLQGSQVSAFSMIRKGDQPLAFTAGRAQAGSAPESLKLADSVAPDLPLSLPSSVVQSGLVSQGQSDNDQENEIAQAAAALQSSLRKNIRDEVSHFSQELESFKQSFAKVTRSKDIIGTRDELVSMKEKLNSIRGEVNEFKIVAKENKIECTELRKRILENFGVLDEAELSKEKLEDHKYVSMLRMRPLDPVTARQCKELRSQLYKAEALIIDLNNALDMQWEAHERQSRKSENRVSRAAQNHQILKTVEAVDQIITNLSGRVSRISFKARGGSTPVNTSKTHVIADSNRVFNQSVSHGEKSLSVASSATRQLSPEKQARLKSFFDQRVETPVRKLRSYGIPSSAVKMRNLSSETPLPSNVHPKAASTPALLVQAQPLKVPNAFAPAVDPKQSATGISSSSSPFFFGSVSSQARQQVGAYKAVNSSLPPVSNAVSAIPEDEATEGIDKSLNDDNISKNLFGASATGENQKFSAGSRIFASQKSAVPPLAKAQVERRLGFGGDITAAALVSRDLAASVSQAVITSAVPGIASKAQSATHPLVSGSVKPVVVSTAQAASQPVGIASAASKSAFNFGGEQMATFWNKGESSLGSTFEVAQKVKGAKSSESGVRQVFSLDSNLVSANSNIVTGDAENVSAESRHEDQDAFASSQSLLERNEFMSTRANFANGFPSGRVQPSLAATDENRSTSDSTSHGAFGISSSVIASSTSDAGFVSSALVNESLHESDMTTAGLVSARCASGPVGVSSSGPLFSTGFSLESSQGFQLGSTNIKASDSASSGSVVPPFVAEIGGLVHSTSAASNRVAPDPTSTVFSFASASVTKGIIATPSFVNATPKELFGLPVSSGISANPSTAKRSIFGDATGVSSDAVLASGPTPTDSYGRALDLSATLGSGGFADSMAPRSGAMVVTSRTSLAVAESPIKASSTSGVATSLPGPFGLSTTTSASVGLFGAVSAISAPSTFSAASSAKVSSAGLFVVTASTVASCLASTTALTASAADGLSVSTSSSGSVFGSTGTGSSFSAASFGSALSTASSIFGSKPNTASSSGGLFNSASTSSSGSLFGSSGAVSCASGGLFGSASVTTAARVFGFGSTTSSSAGALVGTSSKPASVGGAAPGGFFTSGVGLFGSSTPASSSSGLFGSVSSTTVASTELFGSATPATQTGGLFGSAGSSTVTSTGLFGSAIPATQTGGLFGSAGSSTVASTGLFGSATPATQTGGLFGSAGSSTIASTGLFGSATPATQTGGLFGSAGSSTVAPTGVFGSATPATQTGGLFGSSGFSTVTSTGLFGLAPPATQTGGLFGSAGSSTVASTGLFGSATPATQTGGLFGSVGATTVASTGLFGSSFGVPSTSGELFGFGKNSGGGGGFGSGGGSLFGSSQQGTGFLAAAQQKPSGVGVGEASGGSFGFGSFGLGGKPANDPSKNPFGSISNSTTASVPAGLFGSAAPSGSLFGQTGGSPRSAGGLFSKGFGSGITSPGGSGASFSSAGPAFGSAPLFGTTPDPIVVTGPSMFGSGPGPGSSPFGGGLTPFASNAPSFGASTGGAFGSGLFGGGGGGNGNAFSALAAQQGSGAFGSSGPENIGSGAQFTTWR